MHICVYSYVRNLAKGLWGPGGIHCLTLPMATLYVLYVLLQDNVDSMGLHLYFCKIAGEEEVTQFLVFFDSPYP